MVNSKTKKEQFWVPGNIIVTKGDLYPEFYIIKDDNFAYPCNKKTDDVWWKKLSPDNYDDELHSTLPENVRTYWNICVVYSSIPLVDLLSFWTYGHIGETRNGLFFRINKNLLAAGLNNDGSFLMRETYDSELKCNLKNRSSWDFIRIYEINKEFNSN